MKLDNQKLVQVSELVEKVLEEYPETRTNDNLLIYRVLIKNNNSLASKSFTEVMRSTEMSFESITRARRKIQKERPELKDEKTVTYRGEQEMIFRNFYK